MDSVKRAGRELSPSCLSRLKLEEVQHDPAKDFQHYAPENYEPEFVEIEIEDSTEMRRDREPDISLDESQIKDIRFEEKPKFKILVVTSELSMVHKLEQVNLLLWLELLWFVNLRWIVFHQVLLFGPSITMLYTFR